MVKCRQGPTLLLPRAGNDTKPFITFFRLLSGDAAAVFAPHILTKLDGQAVDEPVRVMLNAQVDGDASPYGLDFRGQGTSPVIEAAPLQEMREQVPMIVVDVSPSQFFVALEEGVGEDSQGDDLAVSHICFGASCTQT
jgi:hypothetical protein